MGITVREVQRAVDLSVDPEKITFAEVTQLVSEGRSLPGIATVDDQVRTPVAPKESSTERPLKPWERKKAEPPTDLTAFATDADAAAAAALEAAAAQIAAAATAAMADS